MHPPKGSKGKRYGVGEGEGRQNADYIPEQKRAQGQC